jgi:mono/diheme cytochrome c family protein
MRFVLGMIVGVLLLCLGVYCYFALGFAPTATDAQALPFEEKLAMRALHKRADREAPKTVPLPVDADNMMNGAMVYTDQCAVCHGLPGKERTSIAAGMFPRPPQLFQGKGVTDDPAGETYWKVANGIRLTGMPAFKKTLSDKEMWQVSILLANADKIPQAAKDALQQSPIPTTTAAASPILQK